MSANLCQQPFCYFFFLFWIADHSLRWVCLVDLPFLLVFKFHDDVCLTPLNCVTFHCVSRVSYLNPSEPEYRPRKGSKGKNFKCLLNYIYLWKMAVWSFWFFFLNFKWFSSFFAPTFQATVLLHRYVWNHSLIHYSFVTILWVSCRGLYSELTGRTKKYFRSYSMHFLCTVNFIIAVAQQKCSAVTGNALSKQGYFFIIYHF